MSGSTPITVLDVAERVELPPSRNRPRAIDSSHQESTPIPPESPGFQNVLSDRLQQDRSQPAAEMANPAGNDVAAVEDGTIDTPRADDTGVSEAGVSFDVEAESPKFEWDRGALPAQPAEFAGIQPIAPAPIVPQELATIQTVEPSSLHEPELAIAAPPAELVATLSVGPPVDGALSVDASPSPTDVAKFVGSILDARDANGEGLPEVAYAEVSVPTAAVVAAGIGQSLSEETSAQVSTPSQDAALSAPPAGLQSNFSETAAIDAPASSAPAEQIVFTQPFDRPDSIGPNENFVFSTRDNVNTIDSETTPATDAAQAPAAGPERSEIRTVPVATDPDSVLPSPRSFPATHSTATHSTATPLDGTTGQAKQESGVNPQILPDIPATEPSANSDGILRVQPAQEPQKGAGIEPQMASRETEDEVSAPPIAEQSPNVPTHPEGRGQLKGENKDVKTPFAYVAEVVDEGPVVVEEVSQVPSEPSTGASQPQASQPQEGTEESVQTESDSTTTVRVMDGVAVLKPEGHGGTAILPDSETARIDVNQPDFVDQVARSIRQSPEGHRQVTLRLNPPELGSLQIEISVKDGTLMARLETESTVAQKILLENLPQLKESLARSGISVERVEVVLAENSTDEDSWTFDQQLFHRDDQSDSENSDPDELDAESSVYQPERQEAHNETTAEAIVDAVPSGREVLDVIV